MYGKIFVMNESYTIGEAHHEKTNKKRKDARRKRDITMMASRDQSDVTSVIFTTTRDHKRQYKNVT